MGRPTSLRWCGTETGACPRVAQVPSVAIDRVYYENNTSIMQDEVLAHRLAMVPLRVDPAKLQPKAAGDVATDTNTLVFQLHSKWDPTAATAEPGDENRLMHGAGAAALGAPGAVRRSLGATTRSVLARPVVAAAR